MNQKVEHLSPKSLKNLLFALSRAQIKISEKKKKKEQVAAHIEKIKEAFLRTTKKSVIIEELEKLQAKVNELVEKQTEEQAMLRKLQEKHDIKVKPAVKTLEDFEKISWKLGENVQKLGKMEEEVKPRFEAVKLDKAKELREIEKQLKLLEAKHAKLKRSKKYKASDIKRLEDSIKKHKKVIQEIKSSK